MLSKGTTPEKLVNTMNRQKSSNVGTQVTGDRDPNSMSCDNLKEKNSINTYERTKYNIMLKERPLAGRVSILDTNVALRNE